MFCQAILKFVCNSCPLERFYFDAGGITRQISTIKAPSGKLALKQGKQTYSDQALMYNQISHGSGLLLEFVGDVRKRSNPKQRTATYYICSVFSRSW